jgi:hypothetical protein
MRTMGVATIGRVGPVRWPGWTVRVMLSEQVVDSALGGLAAVDPGAAPAAAQRSRR